MVMVGSGELDGLRRLDDAYLRFQVGLSVAACDE
jgi:hypothetical protein